MNSYMRRYAVFALLAWIAGWTILVLQPCCETIAATTPHDNEISVNTHIDDHALHSSSDEAYPLQTSDLGHEHEQCLDELPTGQELNGQVTLKQDCIDLKTKFTGLPLKTASDLTAISVSDRQYNYNSPQEIPPPRDLYLTTQRLRI